MKRPLDWLVVGAWASLGVGAVLIVYAFIRLVIWAVHHA